MLTRGTLDSLWTWELLVNKSFKQTKYKLASMLTRGTSDSLWTWKGLEYKSNKRSMNWIQCSTNQTHKRITWSWRIMSFQKTKHSLYSKAFFDFPFSNCYFDFSSWCSTWNYFWPIQGPYRFGNSISKRKLVFRIVESLVTSMHFIL